MTLATHGVVGATIAVVWPTQPLLAIGLAFLSHFPLDAIPHWDYPISSLDKEEAARGTVRMQWGRGFVIDLVRIGADGLLGLFLALVVRELSVTYISLWWVMAGAVAGMLPDGLQFVYGRLGGRVLGFIQRIHNFFHTSWRLSGRPIVGIGSQIMLVVVILGLVVWLG